MVARLILGLSERVVTTMYEKEEKVVSDLLLVLATVPTLFGMFLYRGCRAIFARRKPIPYVVKVDGDWMDQKQAERLVREAAGIWGSPAGCHLFVQSNCGLVVEFSANRVGLEAAGWYCPMSNRIRIYRDKLFDNDNDLRLTVAHELGHALGLSHSKGEKDLMRECSFGVSGLSKAEVLMIKRRYGGRR